MAKNDEIGEVIHYYTHLGVAVIKLSSEMKKGDMIEIKGHVTDFSQSVNSMQFDHKSVDVAKSGESIGLKVDDHVREGDKVYKVAE